MKKYFTLAMVGMLALATESFAATQASNTATVAPTLQISATIQKAVSLTLSTGTTGGISHCAVTAGGGDYTMDFGTVDALGINAGNCNKIAPPVPGTDNAIYWSDYKVTPIYTSHTAFGGTTVTAQVTSNFTGSPNNIFVVRSSTATSSATPTVLADFAAMSAGSTDTISGAGTVSGTALTRFIGVAVTPANGASVLQGAQSATVTFTLTVL